MSANDFASFGWWKVISHPHIATWDNYSNLIHHTSIPSSLWITVQIAIGGTILPIIIASLAGYAFAWLDFPGRDWALHRRHRHARRAAADGADPDLLALQPPAPVRHGVRADPLPHGVRAAVRDLPAAQLLHRDTQGHPRIGAHRRRVRDQDLRAPDPAARPARDRLARDLPVPLDLERPARRADDGAQHAAPDGRDLLEPAPVRLQHRPDRAGGVLLARDPAGRLPRVPALLRRRACSPAR